MPMGSVHSTSTGNSTSEMRGHHHFSESNRQLQTVLVALSLIALQKKVIGNSYPDRP
jgi:hypothetical protein